MEIGPMLRSGVLSQDRLVRALSENRKSMSLFVELDSQWLGHDTWNSQQPIASHDDACIEYELIKPCRKTHLILPGE